MHSLLCNTIMNFIIIFLTETDFLLPWEHYVCSKCLRMNPHAIWLVKFKCFEKSSHGYEEEVIVVIESDFMKLIEVRPLPKNYDSFRGKFWMCRGILKHGVCDQSHSYAHSQAEYDSWNAKKTILQGISIVNYACFVWHFFYKIMIILLLL